MCQPQRKKLNDIDGWLITMAIVAAYLFGVATRWLIGAC